MTLKWIGATMVAGLLVLALTRDVRADGVHKVWGSLGVETPLGASPTRPQDDSVAFVGDLHISHLAGPVGAFISGEVKANRGLPWSKEDQFKAGLECPIGNRGLVAYGYYDRRFADDTASRFMLGFRYGFHSAF